MTLLQSLAIIQCDHAAWQGDSDAAQHTTMQHTTMQRTRHGSGQEGESQRQTAHMLVTCASHSFPDLPPHHLCV